MDSGEKEPSRKFSQPGKKKATRFDSGQEKNLNLISSKKSTVSKISKAYFHHSSVTQLEDPRVKEMMSFYKTRDYNEAIAIGTAILNERPEAVEVLYIVGLSCSMLEKHELTIKYFEALISVKPQFKKNVYLFLSISYKKLGKIEASFNVLNKALRIFDSFFEAYVGADSCRCTEESFT